MSFPTSPLSASDCCFLLFAFVLAPKAAPHAASLMAASANFSGGLAALATSADAAVAGADVRVVGGRPADGPAWEGEAGEAVKKRLQGSLIAMNDDTFGYIPVSSGAGILKTFAGAGDADRVTKLKVSRDGSESGSYLDSDQIAATAKSVWLGPGSSLSTGRRGRGSAGSAGWKRAGEDSAGRAR